MPDSSIDAFWCRPLDALFGQTESRPAGLTAAAAAERLARVGPNAVAQAPRLRLARKVARRFAEPLVAILLVAAAISGFTGDVASFAIIFIVIVLSIVLDIVQEHRAEQAADALRRSVAIHADALRDGNLVSFPVEKRAGTCAAAEPADAFNALFAATSVVSGKAKMLVVATGRATRFGDIAASLAGAETQSAFERGIHRLGLLILRLTVFLVLFVLVVQFASGRPAMEAFLFAVALAVGLTPELLPMVMTVTLSRGALRMAAKRVVVKRLAAIHDLGAMDVLCTDKTGTLTEAVIRLVGYPGADGKDSERVLTLAGINSAFESGIRSPLDQAIVAQCGDAKRFQGWRKVDEVPFDFERRCVSVLAEHDGGRILVIKGAPESV